MSRPPQTSAFEFLLNGRRTRVDERAAGLTLLDFIRAEGLTGAKEGCAEGECGACAVAVVAPHDRSTSEYRVVNSCLIPLPLAAGHEIHTVESLAQDGDLSDAQAAMAAAGGSQCGYCTPGFVMSLFAEHYRRGRVDTCDPLALAGNLCRCTGYRPIRDAALALGAAPPGPFRDRLESPALVLEAIASDAFVRPTSVEGCIAALGDHADATMVAGASDLGVEWNLRGRRFTRLVSLDAVAELHEFANRPTAIHIGAALPLTDIGRLWTDAPPAVREWLELFASPGIRNRATLGGNLATASPIGDAAPLLAALDASIHLANADGRREVPIASFFTAYRKTVLRRGELITAIEIPNPLPGTLAFFKISKRRLDDISTVAAAMALDRDGDKRITRARFAFGGVAATPVRVTEAEQAITGLAWDEAAVARVQQILARTLRPLSDHRGSAAYRLDVAQSLVEKFRWDHAR